MTFPRRPARRRLLAASLAILALFLGGCVYLRLLEVKLQLGKFDQYFALRTEEGLTLLCQKPVIRPDDVRWFGVKPESVEHLGQAERWRIRWVKQRPPESPETAEYDIVIELGFADGKLNRVSIPERYFAVMPKAFLVGVIRSFGRGKIDQTGQSVHTSVTAPDVASARPRLAAIDKLLGAPTERQMAGTETTLRYRYVPATRESRVGTFDMILRFDTASGALTFWQAVTPVGKLGFNFGPADR
ncbi:MAG: hypothetical protein HZC55_14235 [Verrucomicrobia bacterium]|nr:hypothetical protein [Verrucomicrobiota bacterium]